MAKRTGGVPYYDVPKWVRWARAHAKETLSGPELDAEWDRINREWEAAECDFPQDVDEDGNLTHAECACPTE